jgi:hypothetical protein
VPNNHLVGLSLATPSDSRFKLARDTLTGMVAIRHIRGLCLNTSESRINQSQAITPHNEKNVPNNHLIGLSLATPSDSRFKLARDTLTGMVAIRHHETVLPPLQ